MMINLKKKSVRQRDTGTSKNFSDNTRSPKPQDQKIEKFLPKPFCEGFGKPRAEKEADSTFLALRQIGSG